MTVRLDTATVDAVTDAGLLSPVRAGTPVEAAVSDSAWLRGMLDAEAALARAQARLGTVSARPAAVITGAPNGSTFARRPSPHARRNPTFGEILGRNASLQPDPRGGPPISTTAT